MPKRRNDVSWIGHVTRQTDTLPRGSSGVFCHEFFLWVSGGVNFPVRSRFTKKKCFKNVARALRFVAHGSVALVSSQQPARVRRSRRVIRTQVPLQQVDHSVNREVSLGRFRRRASRAPPAHFPARAPRTGSDAATPPRSSDAARAANHRRDDRRGAPSACREASVSRAMPPLAGRRPSPRRRRRAFSKRVSAARHPSGTPRSSTLARQHARQLGGRERCRGKISARNDRGRASRDEKTGAREVRGRRDDLRVCFGDRKKTTSRARRAGPRRPLEGLLVHLRARLHHQRPEFDG